MIRIAVGLRLVLALCHPNACSDCGAEVNVDGIHGLSCRYSRGRHSRHFALNDIVKRSDGKRPDGASVVPWQRRKILVWDAHR